MKTKKRGSLKKTLLTKIIIYVAVMIVIITQISIKLAADNIESLTHNILVRETNTYASEIYGWWSSIEERVRQTAQVVTNSPRMSHEDTLKMLLELTANDPDSQDIYIAYGNENVFLDGSGWIPDETFVFTDRPWYQGAINRNGEIFTSDPYVDASTGKTCLACSILLSDGVVLSSDIVFDKVADIVKNFSSISADAKYYIVNKDTKDILISNVESSVGQTLDSTTDPVASGISSVFGSLNTSASTDAERVQTVKTKAGAMMVTATDIEHTSWAVVSAVPASLLSASILKVMGITFASALLLLLILSALTSVSRIDS